MTKDKIVQISSSSWGSAEQFRNEVYGLGESGTLYILRFDPDENKHGWEAIIVSPYS